MAADKWNKRHGHSLASQCIMNEKLLGEKAHFVPMVGKGPASKLITRGSLDGWSCLMTSTLSRQVLDDKEHS
jgi:hypothetical protein